MKKAILSGLALVLLAIAGPNFPSMARQYEAPAMNLLSAPLMTPVNISKSATDSDTPLVGVDGNGAAYVVWFEYEASRSFYSATNKSGQWSSPQYIDQILYNAAEAGYPWLDVSVSGTCHMIFQDGRDFVSYDIFHTSYENGSWSPLTNVSNNDGGSCYSGCAVNPKDNYTYVVWQDGTGMSWGWNILLRFRSPSGSWGATQLLPVGGGYMPQISIDATGTAHLIWTTGWGRTLWYSRNSTPQNASQWSTPVLIKYDVGEDWSYAKVASDNAGNAYIIWMDGTAGNDEIFLRKVNQNGTLSSELNVSQSLASSQEGALGVDKNNGNIIVAWRENNDIYINAVIGGYWTGPHNVTNSTAPSMMPSIAVDASGGTHLVYAELTSGNWEIMYIAYPTTDLFVDLGPKGLWLWDNANWRQLTVLNPKDMIAANLRGDFDPEIIASFDPLGICLWDKYYWNPLSTPNSESMIAADTDGDRKDGLAIDFGSLGLWLWENGSWTLLTGSNPELLMGADMDGDQREELAVDFGSLGLWLWENGAWTRLTTSNPEFMMAADVDGDNQKEIIIDFGSSGLWLWDSYYWTRLTSTNPENMIAADIDGDHNDEIAVDFGSLMLWVWDNNIWKQFSTPNPEDMIAADTDGDSQGEIIVDFGSSGLWLLNSNVWSQIQTVTPESMIAIDLDSDGLDEIAADYGSSGLWLWNNGAWSQLTTENPEYMIAGKKIS